MLFHRRFIEFCLSPLLQPTQALGKLPLGLCSVSVPDFVTDLFEGSPHLLGGPITDLEEAMEKTQYHRYTREKALPGLLGRFPAIGVDRLRGIVAIKDLRFLGENTVASACAEASLVSEAPRMHSAPAVMVT